MVSNLSHPISPLMVLEHCNCSMFWNRPAQDLPNPHNPIIQANGVPYHSTRGRGATGLRVTVGTIPYHPGGGAPAASLQSYMIQPWLAPPKWREERERGWEREREREKVRERKRERNKNKSGRKRRKEDNLGKQQKTRKTSATTPRNLRPYHTGRGGGGAAAGSWIIYVCMYVVYYILYPFRFKGFD